MVNKISNPIVNEALQKGRDLTALNGWREVNRLKQEDEPIHNWYRFVLSFPPHLIRYYLNDFNLGGGDVLLDPFCGTGTTLVEAKLNGVESIGIDANPFAHFSSSVKVNWTVDPTLVMGTAKAIASEAEAIIAAQGITATELPMIANDFISEETYAPFDKKLLIKDSISPSPFYKSIILLACIREYEETDYFPHLMLAFSKSLVQSSSNLRYGPEVGVGKKKVDVRVISPWLNEVERIANDIRLLNNQTFPRSRAILGDARKIDELLDPETVSAVITSPPYPNEKDYTRTTRLESVFLGFIPDRLSLRSIKKNLIRSNTKGVYKEDSDDIWVEDFPEIQAIANSIDRRRMTLGKKSGFERLYGRVTRLYFGGIIRHLSNLREVLSPGANLAYVVGDQASYFRILIQTGRYSALIAERLGYQVERIDLFRNRTSTATNESLREEVLVLRWPGL